jgi:hypothetical protein
VNRKGVIKVISTNLTPPGIPRSIPPFNNCDPTTATAQTGIRGWSTHVQAGAVLDGGQVLSSWRITEADLHNSNLVASELADLQQFCWFEIALGMGHGVCTCGQEDLAF